MRSGTPLRRHLGVALGAALLLALCQVAIETLAVAVRVRAYILSPSVFFEAQMYDANTKLFLLFPGGWHWLRGSMLDHFLPPGILPKLVIGRDLILPNTVVAVALGFMLGAGRYLLRRPPRFPAALAALTAIGLAVHLTSWALNVHVPQAWSIWVIARNAGRVFLWGGTYVAIGVLAAAAATTAFIGRLRVTWRWTVSSALAVAVASAAAVFPWLFAPPSNAAPAAALAEPSPAKLPPVDSVILISIDSLRADRLGCYGNERDVSPTMDRLAGNGIRFADAMSATSWTLPAHVSMLTGRSVLAHGVINQKDRLPEGIPTLAEALRAAGLATGGIVSIPLLSRKYGFARGFDDYDDETIPSPTQFDALADEPAPQVASLGIQWLRAHRGQRFFLFLHFWDVHYDYIPPPPYASMFDPHYEGSANGTNFYFDKAINRHMPQRDRRHILALYDGEIRWVDDHIGQILDALTELGMAANTAVIVTADHGDEFFEHGFKGHGRTLYREVTQVPLIMRVPGAPRGLVVRAPVSLVDIAPTILDLAGARPPRNLSGMSLMPAITGGQLADRAAIHAWLCHLKLKTNCLAMQHSPAGTLIQFFEPLRLEFYAPSDPGQQHNIASTAAWHRRQQLSALAVHLDSSWARYRRSGGEQGTLEVDEATLEKLRALGYLD